MTSAAAPRRAAFASLLAATMASSTFAIVTFSVLSGSLLAAFDLSRWQLGALVTATATVGAVLSPPMGRFSDRIGGRRALVVTLALSAAALAAIALSPGYLPIVGAALAAGAAQSLANPATNKLISAHGAAGGRGALTGIKQSGVHVGTVLGGALLPVGAASIGWRPTVLLAALVPAAALAGGRRVVPVMGPARPGTAPSGSRRRGMARSPFLLRLAAYGFLVGAGWSAVFTYLPDYAQNALGWTPAAGGLLVAAAGACGVAGRIGWSWFAEHRSDAPHTLAVLAGIAVVAVAAVIASSSAPLLLWLGAAALGASSGSWNAVGMFAIIDRLPEDAAGAGSGIVMFGFLVGLGLGAPAFGWSVDVTGGYALGLVAAGAAHAGGLVAALLLARLPVGGSVSAPMARP